MESLVFESQDLGRAAADLHLRVRPVQEFLGPAGVRTRIARAAAESITVDRIDIGFEMSYDADPLGKICLCEVYTGRITDHATDGWEDAFQPGDVVSFAPPDRPYAGRIRTSSYSITMFDPALLTRVAGVGRSGGANDTTSPGWNASSQPSVA